MRILEEEEYLTTTHIQAKRKREELTKVIGEMLLKNWRLLGYSCENCFVPYMKDPEGQVVCVGCGPKKEPEEKEKEAESKAGNDVELPKIEEEEKTEVVVKVPARSQ